MFVEEACCQKEKRIAGRQEPVELGQPGHQLGSKKQKLKKGHNGLGKKFFDSIMEISKPQTDGYFLSWNTTRKNR